jgi:RNA polymerase sigma-70 factor (ECF subfamily)
VPLAFKAAPAIDAAPAFVIIERVRRLWDWVVGHVSSWQDLMAAAQAGDQRAYATLLHEAAPFIRAIARRYHREAAAAEDVVQETLISIHRMRHTHEPGRAVEPWIAAIARARAIDALRAATRRTALETEAANLTADVAPANTASEAAAEVAVALDALPAAQREAVRLLKIEELSLNEAAAASGRTVPALKSLLHRAMSSLRASLRGGRDA